MILFAKWGISKYNYHLPKFVISLKCWQVNDKAKVCLCAVV